MFKRDIDLIKALHKQRNFQAPLLDAGGLREPTIADYEISAAKAIEVEAGGRKIVVPHPEQSDRYVQIKNPWSFIDQNYLIMNPEYGDPPIEELPDTFQRYFQTVIMVSVFEHIRNPYKVSEALLKIMRPGGWLINCVPFLFPHHPSPEDNFRYSPSGLKYIHEETGFNVVEIDWHVNYPTSRGVGDTNPKNYANPQAIMGCYALCQKPQE